ncbi:mitochondrial inner membrane protein OXA1L isoform X2 [Fukomys damarensis]|uniref:mitochondrial inner membrane protein OXA1L isoform X2 n=1 Tax=Fukomys damarensis TaxID=885580 RepID=UPI00053F3007|nr:mitochondrial inner membrane protein OXA1L isoform X2 [Fukomys damarensis]
MAASLKYGRRELLLLLRPQSQFHSVAGRSQCPGKALTTGCRISTGLRCGRPQYVLFAVSSPRCLSTSAVSFAEAQVQAPPVVPATPSPVVVPEVASGETTDVVQAAAEPSFTELGLGSYTPVGLIQNLLEFMHIDLGLPWWGAIAGFYKASIEMTAYQKKHDIKFFRPLILPLTQAPIFISFFIALREMANLPVPSMQTGGLWWFQDLTVSDPMFILPVAVTATMWGVLELGAETGMQSSDFQWMRTVLRMMPLVVFPITIYFPTGVFVYWLTSNLFSLTQVSCLRIPAVRTALKIPPRVVLASDKLPPREGFIKNFKRGWKNAEIAHQLREHERRMQNHLELAAKGPLRQTFTHNPLLQHGKDPNVPTSGIGSDKPKSKQPWRDTLG